MNQFRNIALIVTRVLTVILDMVWIAHKNKNRLIMIN